MRKKNKKSQTIIWKGVTAQDYKYIKRQKKK